ncbi:MAG: NADH-quinone oxidoreductase subunit M [Candidatus Firestonebacteria bacterium]
MGILSAITFIPLIGAIIILFFPKGKDNWVRISSAVFSGISFILSIWLYFNFNKATTDLQFVEKFSWIPSFGVTYFLGVDGLSIPLIVLTGLLSFISIIYSFNIKERVKEYFFFFLLLEVGMMGVFVALDFFLFYVFWEIMLVPMYFLIGIWGGPRKEYAAIKFFLYTLFGSVFMLLAILALYFTSQPHTFNMIELAVNQPFSRIFQQIVFIAFFVGFAIKVPVFPFHTWLPDAHVEAPTAVSVILAGVLLKMGIYGIMRVNFQILPEAAVWFALPLAILAAINIVYGAFVAMAQQDLKKMIAYSSVNHMGYCLLGLASLTAIGFNGAVLQMFNHGIITGALFLLIGVIYERAHTRDLNAFGGLGVKLPIYTGLITVATMASLGLPGLAGFISEFLCFLGAFSVFKVITIISIIGILVTAGYLLLMIQKVFLGPLNEKWKGLSDMNPRELVSVVPLIVIMIILGVLPHLILNLSDTKLLQMANLFSK